MTFLLLLIIVLIAIVFSSASTSFNKLNKPGIVESIEPEVNSDGRVKRAIQSNQSDDIVKMVNKLDRLQSLIDDNSRNGIALEHKIDAAVVTLTGKISSIEEQIIVRSLAAISRKLRVSSQNFGASRYTNQSSDNTLDPFNVLLYGISKYDICAIQDLNVPQSRWDEKRVGITEIFKPILEKRGHYLVLRSFAQAPRNLKNQEICYVTFGFYINPCFNFQFDIETGVETILTDSGVGVLLVHGTLFDKYDAIFACVRGVFSDGKDHYNHTENMNIITRTIERIAEIDPHFYTIIGDFKLRHSLFVDAVASVWRSRLPDIVCESDVLSSGSLLSSFDKHGYSQPDHVLTNMHIIDFRLFQASRVGRMRIESMLYPLKQSTTLTTIGVDSSRIRKLNVPLRQDSVKF